MNNKKISLGLLFALILLLVPALSACGYESSSADGIRHIPHDVDIRFENCFVCHTGGLVPAGGETLGEVHKSYPLELCSSPACHPGAPVEPTTKPTTKPTTDPTTTEPTTGPTTEPTTTEPTTTEPTTSEPSGEPTAEDAPAITSHTAGASYDGLCGFCHMIGGTDPMPDDGYHENYDASECYDCHKVG